MATSPSASISATALTRQSIGYLLFPILILLLIPYLLVGVIAAGKFIQAATKGMFPEHFALTLPNGAPHPLSGGIPPELGGGVDLRHRALLCLLRRPPRRGLGQCLPNASSS